MKNKRFFTTSNMALIAIFTALLAICSWISLSIGPVPFTLQTFGVCVAAGLLGAKRGTVSVVVYILLGAVGVPVFAGFKGGPAVLVGPTGGYIIGFVLSAIVIGNVVRYAKTKKSWRRMLIIFLGMIVGDVCCFVIGTAQFMLVMHTNLQSALVLCVLPYLLPDLAKIIVAAFVTSRLCRTKLFG